MNNSSIRKMLLSGVAVAGFAACSSSSDDPVTTTPDPDPEPPVQQFANSNGLPYAGFNVEGDLDLDDGESKTIALRALRIHATEGDGEVDALDAEVVDLILTFTNTTEGVVIQANLDGETALIGDNDCFTSSTGQSYCINFQFGGFVGGNVVLVYSDGGQFAVDGEYTELAAWVGLETDPELLAGKGLTFYEGSWFAELTSQDLGGGGLYNGGMGMQANFQTGDIEGSMIAGSEFNADFSGSISGNGFTAEIDDVGGAFVPEGYTTGENIGQLEGRFYGVTGEDVAGTIVVDVEVTDDGEVATTSTVSGGGLFQLYENPDLNYDTWID